MIKDASQLNLYIGNREIFYITDEDCIIKPDTMKSTVSPTPSSVVTSPPSPSIQENAEDYPLQL